MTRNEIHCTCTDAEIARSFIEDVRVAIMNAYCIPANDYDRGRNYGLYIAKEIIDNYLEEVTHND